MPVHVENDDVCGHLCPRCRHCDAKIMERRPVDGVRLTLKCVRCSQEWWQK